MAADGKTPPTHPQGGGGNIMCTCSIFVCRHKNNDMSTLLGHVYTYIPTDNTWLQMVRPPQPTHRGGGGNIMCTCSIFVCRHKNNDMSTLLGHAHTYIPTDRQTDRQTDTQAYIHKSIQTYSYTYTWLHMCDVSPLWGGGVGGNQGGLDHIYIYIYESLCITKQNHFKARVHASVGSLFRFWKWDR